MYGINDKVYQNLLAFFKANKKIEEVTLFGSRAKNTASINSDIDLCISYTGTSRASVIDKIDEIVGIYSCDIVFVDQMNKEIEKQIMRDGIVIYQIIPCKIDGEVQSNETKK